METATRDRTDWHALGYRPTPPIATTEVSAPGRRPNVVRAIRSVGRARRSASDLPAGGSRSSRSTQMTEPGTLRASVTVDFGLASAATYCCDYFPPGALDRFSPRR